MSKKITVNIDENLHGRTIESILKKHLGFSETLTGKVKRYEKGILLNGERQKIIALVNTGDVLTVKLPAKNNDSVEAVNIPIEVLYENGDILVVNKPRSMPTHPSPHHESDTLENAVKFYLKDSSDGFHAITRLDKDTSGVVIIAKNALCAKALTEQMKGGIIKKEYIAVVNGVPSPKEGCIEAAIKKSENQGIKRIVSSDGKHAVTEYSVIFSKNGLSTVRLIPVTGRTHQLRVHMSYIGHPIYGDMLYGAPKKDGKTRLHCKCVEFICPTDGKKVITEAQLPEDMKNLIE